ncbi:F-box/LRR-repeat protein 3 [Quillaja saponaria]|uniref:F-box/LRR-repeat protein 3 n=1 Tax=Quillaja saponaria TaxID=32244 RepID=A0AAD7VF67_QUISA|nr:F-box/LRR-repeat protein 3 [Quillaja saponaria]
MLSQSVLCFLTEDLLVQVLEKLDSEADRKTWRLVCKDFYRVESLTRRHLRILRIEFFLGLLQKYGNIESLDLSDCPRIDDGSVSVLVSRGLLGWTRGIRRLVLSRATRLRSSGLDLLIRACPYLEEIDVSHCWVYGDREAAALSYAPQLRELKMDKCLGVTDVGLAKIAIRCTKLERLSLKWCMEISDLGIDLLCKKCLDLKVLDVSYLKVTSESLRSIASLPKLEVLAMVGCPLVDDIGLRYLEDGCPLLKAIDVSRCGCVGSSGLISVLRGHSGLMHINAGYCLLELSASLLECLRNLKNLSVIRIDGVRVSDFALQTITTNCKFLEELGLNKCSGVTNMGIMQLVSGCVNLKILNLTCCFSITDVAIYAIANSCPNLVCLKLESCNMVTEKGTLQLGSRCMILEDLDLTDCSGINDGALKHLSKCPKLVSLKLGLCTNISDKGLVYIASNCPKISELDLYRCVGVGDDGLGAVSTGCKKLTKLNLSYCTRVTDRGMKYISHMDELSDLELRGLVNITSTGLRTVAAGCKRLADLDLKHCEKIDASGFWAVAYYLQNLRQINMSHCAVSDLVLCLVMGNLKRLQDAKLVHITGITVEGLEIALRASCGRIKKVKLLASFRYLLSSEILETLQTSGCKIRWD